MKTVKEIQAEVKREESVLNQLEKRGAASSVIEAQKEAVKAAKKKLEAALNTPTEKAIQSTATTGFVTFNVVKDGETIKESKKIAFVKHNRPIDTKRVATSALITASVSTKYTFRSFNFSFENFAPSSSELCTYKLFIRMLSNA